MTCTVLLVDDHPVVREGLRGMIDAEDDLTVVGEAASGAEAQAMAAEFRVPVVVEVILERVTNIAMGVELTGVNEFEDLAISAEDAPTATALLD